MYTKWAARAGPLFRVKGALFHPDIVSSSMSGVCLIGKFELADGRALRVRRPACPTTCDCIRAPSHTPRRPFADCQLTHPDEFVYRLSPRTTTPCSTSSKMRTTMVSAVPAVTMESATLCLPFSVSWARNGSQGCTMVHDCARALRRA